MKIHAPLLAFAAATSIALALAGCGKSDAGTSPNTKSSTKQEPAPKDDPGHGGTGAIVLAEADIAQAGVKTATLAEEPIRTGIALSATIQPNRDRFAHVAPRVAGRIVEVPAKLGDTVKAGQTLAVLDSVEVGESMSAYQQAASQHAVAKADFERAQRLFDESIVPQKDFLRARSEFEKARAGMNAATDKLRLMGVAPTIGSAASRLPVHSPFAGTVIEKGAVIGELAQPDKSLFTVADLSTVWIEANLYEKDLGRVLVGAEASITVQAYPDQAFVGRLAYVSALVDRETHTVKARIEVPNREGKLKPEMFATAVVQTEEQVRALSVPTEAVVLVDNRSTIFVKDADGFEPRTVTLGELVGGRQVLKAGVSAGDEVVVAGAYALKSRLLKSRIGDAH